MRRLVIKNARAVKLKPGGFGTPKRKPRRRRAKNTSHARRAKKTVRRQKKNASGRDRQGRFKKGHR